MNHYFKRRWDESRGDEFDAWGCSIWVFETDDEFWPVRQIEIYDGGQVLFYDREHLDDGHGGLGDQPLDPEESEECRISAAEFEHEWSTRKTTNRA
jgi:hypothetical protein